MAQLAGTAKYTDCISTEEQYFPNECPENDTQESDDETSVMFEFWGMRSTPLLPSLPGPLYPGVVVPDMVLSMG